MTSESDILRLRASPANNVPLSPISFLDRAAQVFPTYTSTVYESTKRATTWAETHKRCRSTATALVQMAGYLDNPAANEAAFFKDGWFHSGDAAVIHPNNYIQITDRFKDVIISGGENISSAAVEAAIAKHPAILNVAVVAMPSEKYGESPCCFFEVKEEQSPPPEHELRQHTRDVLPGCMCPARFVHFDLPKTASGKILKFELRKTAKALAANPKAKL